MSKLLTLLASLALVGAAANAADNAVANSYIVTYKPDVDATAFGASLERAFERENAREGVKVEHKLQRRFEIGEFKAAAVQVDAAYVAKLKANSEVASVVPDREVQAFGVAVQENPSSWGLSRISQTDRKFPAPYTYPDSAGSGVTVFVLDSGIATKHPDFEGRAVHGTTTCTDCIDTDDNGHGTHCAGTVGSKTHGVAKKVNLVGVKVLNSAARGQWSGIMEGVNWVVNYVKAKRINKAVISMSLGGQDEEPYGRNPVNDAVTAAVRAGITVVVAAGNESQDACKVTPGNTPAAITVGATTSSDSLWVDSNWGRCVDILAPGHLITSTWNNLRTETISGTSMATPHVAGVAALMMAERGVMSPAEVTKLLLETGTKDKITGVRGSPNILLSNKFSALTTNPNEPKPTAVINPRPTATTTPTRPTPTPTDRLCTPYMRILGWC